MNLEVFRVNKNISKCIGNTDQIYLYWDVICFSIKKYQPAHHRFCTCTILLILKVVWQTQICWKSNDIVQCILFLVLRSTNTHHRSYTANFVNLEACTANRNMMEKQWYIILFLVFRTTNLHARGEEEVEDTKVVIRICKSTKDRQRNDQKKTRTKGQARIYKAYI
jgi:hypothetical protein